MPKFYCVRCRKGFSTNDYETVRFKNGATAAKTSCPKCDMSCYRILTAPVKRRRAKRRIRHRKRR